jgi:hypothetical protein
VKIDRQVRKKTFNAKLVINNVYGAGPGSFDLSPISAIRPLSENHNIFILESEYQIENSYEGFKFNPIFTLRTRKFGHIGAKRSLNLI